MEIDHDIVCYLILKAREFDAKVSAVEPDTGSNPSDEDMRGILGDYDDDPVALEIAAAVDSLNIDRQSELVALAWLGRGDADPDGWNELRRTALQRHSDHTAAYLLGIPQLGDYLEEGFAQLGYSCDEVEREHL